jgi:mannose-6-phosphate isomerase
MAMLGNMHRLEVEPGDAVLVPAGTAHAIGEGIFAVELQEPTDFSIMLEFKEFDLDPAGGELGLGRDVAITCVKQKAFSAADIAELRRHTPLGPVAGGGAVQDVMPVAANPYFRAQRVFGRGGAQLETSFAVIVVLSGEGTLGGDGWDLAIKRGQTLVVPWSAGPVRATGDVELLCCRPPSVADARTDDPTA